MSFKKIILAISWICILAACQKALNSHSVGSNGTMDSGGCNGFDHGCLESYAKDVTTLSEYDKVVKPIGERISNLGNFYMDGDRANFNSDGTKMIDLDLPDFFYYIAKMKTWYFVPTALSQIPSDQLGVPFGTEQLALQTKTEIFIDKKKYDALSSQERGELILHELVMEFYLMQFEKTTDLLDRLAVVRPSAKTSEMIEETSALDEQDGTNPMLPPFKGLQPEDYENIRAFTRYLLEESESMTATTFKSTAKTYFPRIAIENTFADRPYRYTYHLPGYGFGDQRNLKVTMQDQINRFHRMEKTNDVPTKCMVDGWNYRLVPCVVRWKISKLPDDHGKAKGRIDFTIQYKSPNGEMVTRTSISYMEDIEYTWYDPTVNPIYGLSQFGIKLVDDLALYDNYGHGLYYSGIAIQDGEITKYKIAGIFGQRRWDDMRILGFIFEDRSCFNSETDNDQKCFYKKDEQPIYALMDDINPTMVDIAKYRANAKFYSR